MIKTIKKIIILTLIYLLISYLPLIFYSDIGLKGKLILKESTVINSAPEIFNPIPKNGSKVNRINNLNWSVFVSDPEGDSFNVSLECSNGIKTLYSYQYNRSFCFEPNISGLDYNSTYVVWVNASDNCGEGSGLWNKKWFVFETCESDYYGFPVNVTLKTNKNVYRWFVEPVIVNITIKNLRNDTIILNYTDMEYLDYRIKNSWNKTLFHFYETGIYVDEPNPIIIKPNESHSWNISWPQLGYISKLRFYYPVMPGLYNFSIKVPIPPNKCFCDFYTTFYIGKLVYLKI